MADENEDIKKEGSENKEETKPEQKHHTWIGDLIEKIDNIDVDFPLSGGEEPHYLRPKTGEELEEERKKDEQKKHNFLHDLDAEFPLSGGEV